MTPAAKRLIDADLEIVWHLFCTARTDAERTRLSREVRDELYEANLLHDLYAS